MNTSIESKLGSAICARLNTIPMSPADRARAMRTLYDAECFVDALMSIATKIEHVRSRLFLRPALKA